MEANPLKKPTPFKELYAFAADALDKIYNESATARKAVIKHYGLYHYPYNDKFKRRLSRERGKGKDMNEIWQHKIADFVNLILHGDDVHKAWLREAGEAFILGKPIPAPRSTKSLNVCAYCGKSAQELKHGYLKRVNRLGDVPTIWICTDHQFKKGEVRHDLLDDSHYFGKPKPTHSAG